MEDSQSTSIEKIKEMINNKKKDEIKAAEIIHEEIKEEALNKEKEVIKGEKDEKEEDIFKLLLIGFIIFLILSSETITELLVSIFGETIMGSIFIIRILLTGLVMYFLKNYIE